MTFLIAGQMKSGKNRVLITRKGRRYAPKSFAQWRDVVVEQLEHQKTNGSYPITSTVSLECEYTPGDSRTRDVDGMLGALLHVIVKAGLLVDDGLVWAVTWRRMEMDREKPGLRFTLRICTALRTNNHCRNVN